MDQTVDGAVGGCLQRVVGTVQPVLQRLQAESDRFDCSHEAIFNNYTRLENSNELFGEKRFHVYEKIISNYFKLYKCIQFCAVTRWGKFKVLPFSVGCAFTCAK